MIRDPKRAKEDRDASVQAQRQLGQEIMELWADESVRELYVNWDGRVRVDRAGAGRQRTHLMIDEARVHGFLAVMAAFSGETLNRDHPSLSCAMPMEAFHGARLQGYIQPRSPAPGFNIRKHASVVYPLESYLDRKVLSFAQYDLLLECVDQRHNILVAGSTASGKTTFLNALIRAMAERCPGHRFLLVEDTAELQCKADDVVLIRTKPGEKMGPVINKEAMRLSPDRIVCGEFRDIAAFYAADLWTSGHDGGAASMHAKTVEGALRRMNRLMLNGRRGSFAELIAEAVQVVVVLERAITGPRVVDVAQVVGLGSRDRFHFRRPQAGALTTGVAA